MTLMSRLEWMATEGDGLAQQALHRIHVLEERVRELEEQLQGGSDVVHGQD